MQPSRGMPTAAIHVNPERLQRGNVAHRCNVATRSTPAGTYLDAMSPPGRKVCYPAEVRCQPRSTSVQRDKSAACSTPAEGQIRASCRRRQGGRFATQQRSANNRVRSLPGVKAARSTHRGTGQTHRVAVAVEEGLQPTRGLPGDRVHSSPMRRYQHLAHNQSGERLDSSKPRPIAHFEKEKNKRVEE